MANMVVTRNTEMGEVIPVEIENMRLDCKVGEGEPKCTEELEKRMEVNGDRKMRQS